MRQKRFKTVFHYNFRAIFVAALFALFIQPLSAYAVVAGPTITSPSDSTTITTSGVTATWDAVVGDIPEDSVTYEYSVDSAAAITTTETTAMLSYLANDIHTFAVRTIFADNTTSEWSTSMFTVAIDDKEAPETSITSATQNGDIITIAGDVRDDNLSHYICYLTAVEPVTIGEHMYNPGEELYLADGASSRGAGCTGTKANGATSFTDTLGELTVTGIPAGSYTAHLVAYDYANNSNAANPADYVFTITRTDETIDDDDTTTTPIVTIPNTDDTLPVLSAQTAAITPLLTRPEVITTYIAPAPTAKESATDVTTTVKNSTNESHASPDTAATDSRTTNEKNTHGKTVVAASWSAINLVLTGLIVTLSVIALVGFTKHTDEKHTFARLATVVIAAGTVILFFATESTASSIGWVNWWTILYSALFIAQLIIKPSATHNADTISL